MEMAQAQALIDVLVDQRNAALNALAQVQAELVALKRAKATEKPKEEKDFTGKDGFYT